MKLTQVNQHIAFAKRALQLGGRLFGGQRVAVQVGGGGVAQAGRRGQLQLLGVGAVGGAACK